MGSCRSYHLVMASLLVFAFAGCQREENLVDIETPDGSIEVNEGEHGIEIEIDTDE